MNLQGYITSGNLELYVHGLASPEEVREVEGLMAQHPEIQEEIDAIRHALEAYAMAHATPPPEGLKEKIIGRLDETPKGKSKSKPVATPPLDTEPRPSRVAREESGGEGKAQLAAWVLGLAMLGAGVLAFLFFQQANVTRKERQEVQAAFDQYKKECAQKDSISTGLQKQLDDIRHWGNKPIAMQGTPLSKDSYAIVYQNTVRNTALLNVVRLPVPPAGKQYQLWAIVAGKPADMGVFEVKKDSNALQTVPYMESAQAFAVTLEEKGGSPTPTMEQMYVVGAVGKK